MFTKMVLPLLGGSPAIWNIAVVFFQATLLAGYLYAHAASRFLGLRTQTLLHLVLLAAAFATLPVSIAHGWNAPGDTAPVIWLIGLLTVSIGAPLFAVSATAPLLQSWFARTGHKSAGDPYFLYGASNLGSLLALLAYPIVIEPGLGLDRQGQTWAWGYAAFAVLLGLTALATWRRAGSGGVNTEPSAPTALPGDIGLGNRVRWVLLAFAPASLFLGVTLHISTDVAAAPFLWVGPLAIYLLSFVLVFARKPVLRHDWMVEAQVFVLIPLAVYFWVNTLWLVFLVHLTGLFFVAMVCHGELAKRRPATRYLTEFYLWMSVGGVLGGVFSALIAPMVFDSVIEYPLALVIACMLRPMLKQGGRRAIGADIALPAGLALLMPLPYVESVFNPSNFGETGRLAFFGAVALALYWFRQRPLRLALGIGAVLAVPNLVTDTSGVLAQERSFFGVYQVEAIGAQPLHQLRHGTTLHGLQLVEGPLRREPLSYYGRQGPLGQIFASLNRKTAPTHVAAVGLGVGTIACYRRSGQTVTFFEIDPAVERLARDPRLFRYLADCGEGVRVRLGDGRLGLAREADGRFDLIVLDAFSSDAIPVHLITREALALYVEKLTEGGIVAFHISNNFVDLKPVLATLAAESGLVARVQKYDPVAAGSGRDLGISAALFDSVWVVVARTHEDLAALVADGGWQPLASNAGDRPWTDDYSNVLKALIWERGFDTARQSHGPETK